MADIAQRGNRLTQKRNKASKEIFKLAQGKRIKKFGGGRTNLLEELGRVEAEPSNPNRRAEISRVHGELNKGYATGGRVGLKKGGKPWGTGPKPGTHEFMMQNLHKRKGKAVGGVLKLGKILAKKFKKKKVYPETEDLTHQVGPYVGDVGSEGKKGRPKVGKGKSPGPKDKEAGPRAGAKKGGKADKKWIQKAVNPKHKGYCTPMTKKTCTPARKALARTFKKKAKTGW
jgi:hypothetical protein